VALLGYAVTVAGNLLGFIGYRYWMSWAARAAASKDHARYGKRALRLPCTQGLPKVRDNTYQKLCVE